MHNKLHHRVREKILKNLSIYNVLLFTKHILKILKFEATFPQIKIIMISGIRSFYKP